MRTNCAYYFDIYTLSCAVYVVLNGTDVNDRCVSYDDEGPTPHHRDASEILENSRRALFLW